MKLTKIVCTSALQSVSREDDTDMNIFYTKDISPEEGMITGQELIHCTKVLRRKAGDTIHVMDGAGHLYQATIDAISKSRATLRDITLIQSAETNEHLPALAIGILKNNTRMEWLMEKATEIGVREIIPLYCHHSERKHLKVERLEKIVLSATKQSKQLFVPKVHELTPFKTFVDSAAYDHKIIAHYRADNEELADMSLGGGSTIMLIGPEGDFSPEEVSMAVSTGYRCVNLGTSRLRAETAGMVALALLNNK